MRSIGGSAPIPVQRALGTVVLGGCVDAVAFLEILGLRPVHVVLHDLRYLALRGEGQSLHREREADDSSSLRVLPRDRQARIRPGAAKGYATAQLTTY